MLRMVIIDLSGGIDLLSRLLNRIIGRKTQRRSGHKRLLAIAGCSAMRLSSSGEPAGFVSESSDSILRSRKATHSMRQFRNGLIWLYTRILRDTETGCFLVADFFPEFHRHAENRLLRTEAIPLGAGDALRRELALAAGCRTPATYDRRLTDACGKCGLAVFPAKVLPK